MRFIILKHKLHDLHGGKMAWADLTLKLSALISLFCIYMSCDILQLCTSTEKSQWIYVRNSFLRDKTASSWFLLVRLKVFSTNTMHFHLAHKNGNHVVNMVSVTLISITDCPLVISNMIYSSYCFYLPGNNSSHV